MKNQRPISSCVEFLRSAVLSTCLVALFFGGSLLQGQGFTAEVLGTVTDSTGGLVAGAVVTAANLATGVHSTAVTDSKGTYTVVQLPPGDYKVTAEAPGFKRSVQANITVQVDATERIDIKLELGEVTQQVTVTGAAPLLESQKTDVATTISLAP